MGKNQAYKAMQRARMGTNSNAPPESAAEDGMMDGSFHSPEWHAARLASLNTSHTITWEEFKRRQKEDELKKGELEADKDRMMREYRAQLDAERASKLAHGRNHTGTDSNGKKDRKERKRKGKKRKRSRRSSESSSSSSSDSSTDDDEDDDDDDKRESKRRKSKSKSKRSKKERRHKSKSRHDKEAEGPVPLSRFFSNVQS